MNHEHSAGQRPEEDFPNQGTYTEIAELYGLEDNSGPVAIQMAVIRNPITLMDHHADLRRQYADLRRQVEEENLHSRIDSLTELPNRRAWDEALDLMDEGRFGVNPAVVVIDLDRFKTANDEVGHAFGDAILVATADKLRSLVRSDDALFFRTGGDEFTAILRDSEPDADPRNKRGKFPQSREERIEAIRSRLHGGLREVCEKYEEEYGKYRHMMGSPSGKLGLDASVGVAIFEEEMSSQEAVIAADKNAGEIKREHKKEEFFRLTAEQRRAVRAAYEVLKAAGIYDPRTQGHSFEEDENPNL